MRDPPNRRKAREALSVGKRAYAVRLRQHGATQAQIGVALGLSPTRVGQILAKAERLASRPQWHNGLNNTRALHFLRMRGLADLAEIEAALAAAQFTRRELMVQPNFGTGACAAMRAWLATHGLGLRDETPTAETEKGRSLAEAPF
jgi:hypothetical protein